MAGPDIFRSDVLAGKSILVTGGGSGLGHAICTALAAKGAVVHIRGRRAKETARAIGAEAHWHVCDVRDADQVEAMFDAIRAIGPLTGLVNNAAANFIAPDQGPQRARLSRRYVDGNGVDALLGHRYTVETRRRVRGGQATVRFRAAMRRSSRSFSLACRFI